MDLRPLWLLLPLVSGCSRESKDAGIQSLGSGVLVIEIDGWRKDHVSTYGYEKPTMPFLDRMAQDSLLFEDAWSTGSDVLSATVALLTGCDPSLSHHPGIVLDSGAVVPLAFPWEFPEDMPLLAFQFLVAGWNTGLFDGTGKTNEIKRLRVGFETLGQSQVERSQASRALSLTELQSTWLEWLGGLEHGADWYAHLHVADLEGFTRSPSIDAAFAGEPGAHDLPPIGALEPVFHALPPSRVSPELARLADYLGAYDTALRKLDRDLETLVETLDSLHLLGRTTIVLVGGYGMGFGESGLYAAAGTLSEVDLAVPLIFRPAVELGVPLGRRFDALVSLVDVAPTVLDLARLPIPLGWQGHSLRPLWSGQSSVRSHAFAIPAIHQGVAVIDSKGLYARWWPQRGGSKGLEESWFGSIGGHEFPVEALWARREGLRAGAYRQGLPDPAWATELRAKADEWGRWSEGLAAYLHSDPFGNRLPSWIDDPDADPPFEGIPTWVR